MRSLAETKTRWEQTLVHSSSFADLQRAVKFNGPNSPCLAGCRSVCWKAFLLFQDAAATNWSHILLESRNTYSSLRGHYLKYIKHPEQLAELSFDPLADDPDSPWIESRKDELIRAEILQDVQRLPDEPLYHEERVQTLILDILFIYCKLNPEIGGYRQGMHELLAPLVYVVDQDAIDRAGAMPDGLADPVMAEMLDASFIEHDAFALFSRLMEKAKNFYEISPAPVMGRPLSGSGEKSAIVEKSKQIHEVSLMRVDPQLSTHLKSIEILPQVFLIRWIRLLFGREFPFEQLLILWDTIFVFDPSLQLIDLVCVAMLIRIRWTLLEADYSMALQLLLKYPVPQAQHGPHTFVDDAIYLRDHYNAAGGSTLIMKYTGKAPAGPSDAGGATTPTRQLQGLSLRQRTLGARSPLSSPARFIGQQASVEAIFQGAAKGVIERGEKLGINQAVRDAMGEIRRNMQGFQEARSAIRSSSGRAGDIFANGPILSPPPPPPPPQTAAAPAPAALGVLEWRNKQLAAMLEEMAESLEALAASKLEDKDKAVEAIEVAAAKARFVKVYLEDPTMDLPEQEQEAPQVQILSAASSGSLGITLNKETVSPTVALDTTVVTTATATAVETPPMSPGQGPTNLRPSAPTSVSAVSPIPEHPLESEDPMETDPPVVMPAPAPEQEPAAKETPHEERPTATPPTRSTLAQPSFSWMLEPDMPVNSASLLAPSTWPSDPSVSSSGGGGGGGGGGHRNCGASGHTGSSRGPNAFLFGEVTSDSHEERRPVTSEDIFGLEPIGKSKG